MTWKVATRSTKLNDRLRLSFSNFNQLFRIFSELKEDSLNLVIRENETNSWNFSSGLFNKKNFAKEASKRSFFRSHFLYSCFLKKRWNYITSVKIKRWQNERFLRPATVFTEKQNLSTFGARLKDRTAFHRTAFYPEMISNSSNNFLLRRRYIGNMEKTNFSSPTNSSDLTPNK